ncbi:MAG TPA: hypothetical protein VFF41_05600 [Gallionella sp.]|nr:hypothetical protein [Gallionella sp.]
MKLAEILFFTFILSGCQDGRNIRSSFQDIRNSFQEATGTYTAPWLEGSPTIRGCADKRCRALDAIEANGYDLARQKKITWVSMVDTYYQKRKELFQNSLDDKGVNELRVYQRYLAEQIDSEKITESEWAYRIVNKENEIKNRNQMLEDSAAAKRGSISKDTTCNTINIGTAAFPNYQTTCN